MNKIKKLLLLFRKSGTGGGSGSDQNGLTIEGEFLTIDGQILTIT